MFGPRHANLVLIAFAITKVQVSLRILAVSPEPPHACDKFQKGIGRFSFHFREIYKKCIEYIGRFLIQIMEISKLW